MRVEDVTHSQALPSPSMSEALDSLIVTSHGRPGLRERKEGKEREREIRKRERKKKGSKGGGKARRSKRLEFMP